MGTIISLDIAAALGAMLCWGFGDFIIQKATRKIGDMEALAWIGVLGSIGLLPFVWHDLYLVLNGSNLLVLSILGIVAFIIGIINFEALKRGKISVVEVILEAELPVAVLLGLFFFRESLSGIQIFLILLVFAGIILIALEPGQIKKRHFFEKGALLALVAAVGYGLIDFLTAVGAKTISPLLTIWFTWVIFTIICLFYMAWHGELGHFFRDAKQYKTLVLSMGIIDTLAWILFAIAVRNNELAITVAITESYPAIGLMLGVLINKEKVVAHQYAGAIIAVVASFAMGLFIR
jgi:drug/metabolite transporter (DMT)-like permease